MISNRIVVTGAAGFIGSHVCEALIARGDEVLGVDNFDPYYARELKEQNLGLLSKSSAFHFAELDICKEEELVEAMRSFGATGVIHLAATAGERPSIADPCGYARANVLGTQSVLSAASAVGCSRAVCASSSSVYGNNVKTPFAETDSVEHPISPYAATKRSCELIAHAHHHLSGMPVSMLRFFTVFGPRQRPDLAINLFLRTIGAGGPIRMFGDGTTSRDYTFIDDIVGGVLSAYEKTPGFGFRVWNLGGDHPITLKELIGTIGEVVGREPVVEQEEMQPGDVERTWADLSRAAEDLGYSPETSIRDGIMAQWAWMQSGLSSPQHG
jgi:UDP-glucuronate 4-epimerase